MTDQLYINDQGGLEEQPLTWDGEPLYSQETVQEALFAPEAFEQQPGQLAIDNSPEVVEQRRDMFKGFGWGVS